ncbi:16S rRNA (adenine(1518)-N(6)/adenine(1519)-N(6))-dimethyltransferase RsmA [Siculibacillus lacustris]|uniref:Ribosomal RNA small subunit methyltransferase A n=1 Tax=Siculibacillus lacustris TaxID=1549641 RepID=A0A4Q9VWW0_9HYPH|nr:16S rRNA (adenine(1518)-N(6)/adenine(1519)-N(6))-dimethyltransferase RsmA [Siculibacillus lacustris]TBW39774.1 16S rRNA (adenine(1518)-N(6)/adenine(1519)-N(6))-dimethyltransferase RsmA [Siculibacillus lacustris]
MTAIDDLPPLRDVIARHGLSALKSLGQNFLLDLNLTSRIARASGAFDDELVIEVGPGPGGLTRALLAAGARKVVAIERDPRCLAALAEIAERHPGRLEVIEGDALEVDIGGLVAADAAARGTPGARARICANLPYNVATPLLVGWLRADPWPPWWSSATLMFQREVAERIVATEADDAYGRLGVLAGWRADSKILFDLSPQAFTPPPKVTSSVVRVVPRAAPLAVDPDRLERVVAAAFGQRRKMLRQSLKPLGPGILEALAAARIEPTRRAEEIDVAGFVRLTNALG